MPLNFESDVNYVDIGSPSSPSPNHYYSATSSPTALLGYESEKQKDDNRNSNFNGFEFERSQSFRYPLDVDTPMMSFADELFRNGLIMPIKPPPSPMSKGRYLNSATSSPTSILKNHFSRHSKWDDEFDPFVIALQKVREERMRSGESDVPTRRTRSLSPFKENIRPQDHHDELAKPKKSHSNRWLCRGFKENEPKKKIVSQYGNDSVFGRRDRSFCREKTHVKKEQIATLWMKSLGKLSFKLKGNCNSE